MYNNHEFRKRPGKGARERHPHAVRQMRQKMDLQGLQKILRLLPRLPHVCQDSNRPGGEALTSQWEVYEAIQLLGGKATFAQIKQYMTTRYRLCSDSSTHNALQRLICNDLVTGAPISKNTSRRLYSIAGKFPERNVIAIKTGGLENTAA